jgi:hypothetical protein
MMLLISLRGSPAFAPASPRYRAKPFDQPFWQPFEERKMSWLKKIVSTISARSPEQPAEDVLDAMPTAQCVTAEAAPASVLASEPVADTEDENPIKQRRYFVKKGLYVDNEEERAAARLAESSAEEIPDRHPVDLKTLFPKLSLR